MPKGKRLSKEELRRDPVKEFLLNTLEWGKKNSEKVLWGSVVFVALVIGSSIYFGTRSKSTTQGKMMFLSALAAYAQNDTTRFVSILNDLMSTSSGTPEGKRAIYYMAQYKLEKGELDQAELLIKKYLKSKLNDPFLDAGAYATLGSIYLEKGDIEESAKNFLEAAKIVPYETFQVFYRYRAARVYMDSGKYKKALQIMENLVQKHSNNSFVQEVVKNEIPILKGAIQGEKVNL